MDDKKMEALLTGLTEAVTAFAGGKKSDEKKHADIVDEDGNVPVPEEFKGKHYYLRTKPGFSKGHYREKGELVILTDEIPGKTLKPLNTAQVAAIRAKDKAKRDAAAEDEEPQTEDEIAAASAEEPEAEADDVDPEAPAAKPAKGKAAPAAKPAKAKRPSDTEV